MQKRIAYDRTAAHERLAGLKEKPFDLSTLDDASFKQRLQDYICSSSYFSLFYWSQRLDDEVLAALQSLADECALVPQFQEMKNGAVMNAIEGAESESRQVLHTASRDIFVEQPCNEEATNQAVRQLSKLKLFLEEIDEGQLCNGKKETFTTLIHVGIGGSDLGPRSICEALKAYGRPGRTVHFLSNVDPDDAAAVLRRADLSRSLVAVVSKSGTTLETLTNEELVRDAFRAAGLDPAEHCISITGEGSPMDAPERYRRSFYMYDYIGGRYSSTSMVGLVTLGFFLGYEQILDFLEGASNMDYLCEQPDVRGNQALLLALLGIWNHSYLNMSTLAVLPYSQGLHRFPAHLQQLDMESNGKSIDRQGKRISYQSGPVIWGECGTNGQHAFFQLLHQGTERVPCEFIGFYRSQYAQDMEVDQTSSQQKLLANLLAQSVALARGQDSDNPNRVFPGNRPSSVLLGERLTPGVMGALLALYEAKVVFQGFAWNINSFDQEGVQLGKVLAGRFLEEMKGGKSSDDALAGFILETMGTV